jgi:hypothetical protein
MLSYLSFDVAYLALLTKCNLKRLSRWEGRLSSTQVEILRELGLEVTEIRRRLLFGRKTYETVFSLGRRWTDLYRSRFEMTRISETSDAARLKGFLFGYPACCVEAFIRKPYSRNGLLPRDQEILFHWACPGCKVTPGLVKSYRAVHDECLGIFGGTVPARAAREVGRRTGSLRLSNLLNWRTAPLTAGLAALLMLPTGGCSNTDTCEPKPELPDDHVIAIGDDTDGDYLAWPEEILSGTSTGNYDTGGDGVADAVARAHFVHELISNLPDTPSSDRPYKIDMAQRGVEICETCGAVVNMGFVRIVNPARGLEMEIPYICLHYLEHGGLYYEGDIHEGRLDLAMLKRVLPMADEAHMIAQGCARYRDTDSDGLCNDEEGFLGTDPDKPDSDRDSVKDGPQFVEDLLEAISQLPRSERTDQPYLIENPVFGHETCRICGGTFNMGHVTIVNPLEDLSVDVPYVALHYLAHGSSSFEGTENADRIMPVMLRTILTGDGTAHMMAVEGDADGDGLKDEEEAHFSLDPAVGDTDGDGTLDGPQLAKEMCDAIDALPVGPLPDTTYVLHHQADGIYICHICGEAIDMGFMEIVDARAGTSVDVPYYNFHFMRHGGFATDRAELYPRIDPRDIDAVLNPE